MKTSLLSKRFSELREQWEKIEAAKQYMTSQFSVDGYRISDDDIINWEVKALNLLEMACRKDSVHVSRFKEQQEPQSYRLNYEKLKQLGAVFDAAREDFQGGYLNSVRNLIQSEVFDSELEQAKELLSANYKSPAAVVAGVVLETALRQMCSDRELPIGKLDKMNADLVKAEQYNLQVQKRITALADIRNCAAHGHSNKFSNEDVADMIAYVERFVGEHLS